MTAQEIIEKIRAEIEQMLHSIENCPFISGELGAMEKEMGEVMAYKNILSFLSDLEKSEKPNDQWSEEDEEMMNSIIATCKLAQEERDSSPARHLFKMQERWLKSHYSNVKSEKPTIQKQSVWHDVEKETPTSFGEGVIVLCKNKNKEDGIWLTDFIPCWEGEWTPRDNWETPVNWAYVRDFYPKAEQSVTLSVQDAMKALDEKIAKVKKAGSWKNSELLDEMREEQPVCEGLEEEISRYLREDCSDDDEPSISEVARHFAQWGAEHRGSSEIPNDLEEAAKLHRSTANYGGDINLAMEDSYKKGAKWQKEQMMKEAVESEVWNYSSNEDLRAIPIWGINKFRDLKDGDGVKIIIVKED